MHKKYKVGILQINPHTLWRKGGGEVHASKYIEHGNNEQFEVEAFDFTLAAQYDLIHFFGSAYQMNEIGKYAQAEGIKVVGTPILYPSENNLKYKMFLAFGKKLPFKTTLNLRQELLQDCDALITNSEPEANYISNAYGIKTSKLTTLGTGVSQSFFDYGFQENDLPIEVGNMMPYCLMVGRVTPLKNQLIVAESLKNTKHNLLIVGKPDPAENAYCQKLEEIAANCANIHWIKGTRAESNDLKAIYNQALCHILWSSTEVAALVNMEAMALSCPTVSRNLPTTKSILQEHGSFAGSEHELINQIELIENWDNSQRLSFTQAAKKHVQENHTWEKIVQKSMNIYLDLLK